MLTATNQELALMEDSDGEFAQIVAENLNVIQRERKEKQELEALLADLGVLESMTQPPVMASSTTLSASSTAAVSSDMPSNQSPEEFMM